MGQGLRVSMASYKPWLDESDPDKVFFASVHLEHAGFYPDHQLGLEQGRGTGNIVSVPLSHGTKSAAFRRLVAAQLLPRLSEFEPDLIVVSAGFDGHSLDAQGNGGGLQLVDDDYAWITQQLVDIADRCAHGRIVSVLEGGYHVPVPATRAARSGGRTDVGGAGVGALASSVAAHVSTLCARPRGHQTASGTRAPSNAQ